MTGQQGFFGPRTATGKASLLPAPPWHYSGDLLTVEFRVHPDRVRDLLPEPLELAPEDPGAVAFIWADWQSCAADGAQLLDPVLAQYKEAFVVVRCSYRGEVYSRCAYIWVDTDFAVARGLHPETETHRQPLRDDEHPGDALPRPMAARAHDHPVANRMALR